MPTEGHDDGAGDTVGHDHREDAHHPSVGCAKLELVGLMLGGRWAGGSLREGRGGGDWRAQAGGRRERDRNSGARKEAKGGKGTQCPGQGRAKLMERGAVAESEVRVGTVMGPGEGPSRGKGLAGWWVWELDAQSPLCRIRAEGPWV